MNAKNNNIIVKNKNAARNYHLTDKFQAGLVLEGWEVKGLRDGKVDVKDSYVTLKNNEAWVNGFKMAIRSSTAKGWTVREHRGLARLEVRTCEGMRSAQLMKNNIPFSYSAQDMGDIITRVRNIYVEMANNGGDFDSAVAVCAGLAPKLTYSHDWVGAKEDFEKYK